MDENFVEEIVNEGVHNFTSQDQYQVPNEVEVQEKLEWFKDQKLGFMTHFGIFNQAGMVESWILSDEAEDGRWSQSGLDWDKVDAIKEQYTNLNKSFNPIRFEPDRWANFIANHSFKYVIMPSKHHDGFCMWDTKYTEYKTTSSDCPFSTHKHADILGSLLKEFREKNLGVGAYFSKADWNVESYWPAEYKKNSSHRNVGYSIEENPELWNEFVEFTQGQLKEISLNYGSLDILWLDAGWVYPEKMSQDIKLEEVVAEIRQTTPDMLVCDRTCGGQMENYVTPEQSVPEHTLDIPWESCISLGPPFAYSYDDRYKSPTELAHLFIDILTRGGNLVINVAPQPNGQLPHRALRILSDFSNWVEENAEAIFATRPIGLNGNNNVAFTKAKDNRVFMFNKMEEETNIPKFVHVPNNNYTKIALLDGTELKFENYANEIRIYLPEKDIDSKAPYALVFEVEYE